MTNSCEAAVAMQAYTDIRRQPEIEIFNMLKGHMATGRTIIGIAISFLILFGGYSARAAEPVPSYSGGYFPLNYSISGPIYSIADKLMILGSTRINGQFADIAIELATRKTEIVDGLAFRTSHKQDELRRLSTARLSLQHTLSLNGRVTNCPTGFEWHLSIKDDVTGQEFKVALLRSFSQGAVVRYQQSCETAGQSGITESRLKYEAVSFIGAATKEPFFDVGDGTFILLSDRVVDDDITQYPGFAVRFDPNLHSDWLTKANDMLLVRYEKIEQSINSLSDLYFGLRGNCSVKMEMQPFPEWLQKSLSPYLDKLFESRSETRLDPEIPTCPS